MSFVLVMKKERCRMKTFGYSLHISAQSKVLDRNAYNLKNTPEHCY